MSSHLEKFALMTLSDVAVALKTSLDTADLWASFGKAVEADEASVGVSRSVEPTSTVSSATNLLVSQEVQARASLMESAAEAVFPLACSTMSDDETSCIRCLPRATLEALVLSACSTYRSFRPQCLASGVPHPFGPILGPQFEALVTTKRARSAAAETPSFFAASQRVRRNAVEMEVPSEEIVAGDVLLLSIGDAVPCDALLLSVHPPGCEIYVDPGRIIGSSLTVERRAGPYRACPVFGAQAILPQQSILVGGPSQSSTTSGGGNGPHVVVQMLAVALQSQPLSSWVERQRSSASSAVATALQHHQPSEQLCAAERMPLMAVPQASIHQFQRHGVLKLALCDTVMVECESTLLNESVYEVAEVVWSSTRYAAPTVATLRNYSDVLASSAYASASSCGASSPGVIGGGEEGGGDVSRLGSVEPLNLRVDSFISSADHPARVTSVSGAKGLRTLMVATMLASCYPHVASSSSSSSPSDPRSTPPHPLHLNNDQLALDAIRRFVLADDHMRSVAWQQYVPIADPTSIAIKGYGRINARLFAYAIPGAASHETRGHAVLVIYGDALSVLGASSFMATARGQTKVDAMTKGVLEDVRANVVCAPNFLFGVATADILWDYVGTKNVPSPSDLSSLLAQTTSLCFQGAVICNVCTKAPVVEGIKRMAYRLQKRVCVISFARSSAKLSVILARCGLGTATQNCSTGGNDKVRVVVPDLLGRWRSDRPPDPGEVVGLSAVGCDPLTFLPDVLHWCRQDAGNQQTHVGALPLANSSPGVAYCGSSCGAAVGLTLCDVAIMAPSPDPVVQAILRNLADISISNYALDDLADAVQLANEHIAETRRHIAAPQH